jgi:HK97 family phage major capsid protein
MNSIELNKRKNALLDEQELMLKAATEAHSKLTADQETRFEACNKELDEINKSIVRFDAIAKSKSEIALPNTAGVIAESGTKSKFYAFGSRTPLDATKIDTKAFWASLKSKSAFDQYLFTNAALGEGGTAADGSALVPIQTDPSIPNLQMVECSARSLSTVITTEMDLNVPYQSGKTVASQKAESNNSSTNAFATSVPTFATTKLSAYMLGDSVFASWELLQDAKAAGQFITADLARAIRVAEESAFISGTGSGQPQGYLGNATAAVGATITAGAGALSTNNILDTMATLNRAYYSNATWLVNRQEAVRLFKAQLAASQFQTYFTFDTNGAWRLLGFPMEFSAALPVFNASPLVTGAWLFGDFSSYAVIGDRGDSSIKIKVLDQVAALNGQTVILGYRRVDQRVILQEAVIQLNTNA